MVREPLMHFYRVPRLGAFMAVPLVYNSCLSESALDNAVADFLDVQKRKDDQERVKSEWEDEKQREREEKERTGGAGAEGAGGYESTQREWEEITEKPYDTEQEQYVVCLDVLGQDREFTDDEKRFVLNTTKNFKDIWEKTERENLLKDRNRKLEIIDIDREFLDNDSIKYLEEEDKHVEETIGLREDLDNDAELKELHSKETRIRFIARQFKDKEEWKKSLLGLREFTVMKIPRVLQSVFYFLMYEQGVICEHKSNKFFWKKAKEHLNEDLLHRLANYRALGPKDHKHQKY